MKKNKIYFTSEVDTAIDEYNKSNDSIKRNKIFEQKIEKPLKKLIEILINTGKFYYVNNSINETKSELMLHVLEKLPKYDKSTGKAYSYFTVIIWNWLVLANRARYEIFKRKVDSDSVEVEDVFDFDQRLIYFDIFIDYLNRNLVELFPKRKDFEIANAIMEIINRRDKHENFNKKAIFFMIREMVGCDSQSINRVNSIFKKIYDRSYQDYLKYGSIQMTKNYRGYGFKEK